MQANAPVSRALSSAASAAEAPRSLATSPRSDRTADPFERLLQNIEALAPAIASRAAEIESGRRIPPDLVEKLRSIGLFRMFVPQSHGGMELDLPRGLQIVEALGRIESSVGWVSMIATGSVTFLPLLPRAIFDHIYRDGPDVILAGSAHPAGTAEAVDGGWHVSGRWPFASGCQHADWLLGLCVMRKDGEPLPGPAEGVPLVRAFVWPARHWSIEDTWHVAGLKGTASHHIALGNAVIPAEYFFSLADSAPCISGPLYANPPVVIPLAHAALGLGIAAGALGELVDVANSGRQQRQATVPMKQSEIFQYELGRAEAELKAARALLVAQAASHWRHAIAGSLKGNALMTEGTQAAVWIVSACVRIADMCFTLGGGTAVYESSPLQRRMRDLRVAAQHAAVQQRHYAVAGALLLGNDVRPPGIGR